MGMHYANCELSSVTVTPGTNDSTPGDVAATMNLSKLLF